MSESKPNAKNPLQQEAAEPPPGESVSSHGNADPLTVTGDYAMHAPNSGSDGTTAAAAPQAFDRYQVRGFLGKGGFGSVYLGYDAQLDRQVAIKVPNLERRYKTGTIQQFLQEARRIARLRHPSIVTIFDMGVQDEQVYLITDFIEGTNLSVWLKSHHPSWQEAARIAAAVADALACAHEQRVVHRDVKPNNILLTRDLVPVLIDFGLALGDDVSTESQRHRIFGTPLYMSPEQARGEGHRIDGRTDIFSLGVVLYQMLCGRTPFRASQAEELMRQIREDEPQPPRQLIRDLPRELERICLKALAKRISDRFTTAGDLAEELRRVLAGALDKVVAPAPVMDQLTQEYTGRAAEPRQPETQTAPPIVETACAQCGHGNPATAQFCGHCGAAVAQSASPPRIAESALSGKPVLPPALTGSARSAASTGLAGSGVVGYRPRDAERRQVTMLFVACDLFDSAAYLENLDAEEQHEVLRAYQEACMKVVQSFDGATVQLTDQGLLFCFGYPQAHEDSSHRAVRAGLAILEAMTRLNERQQRHNKITLAVTIGIHTGMVVVGDQAGGSSHDTLSVVGEARTVVTRIESIAKSDAVVISNSTYRLVQGYFACQSLGRQAVKGVSKPLEFHQVLGETEAHSRMDVSGAVGLTPLTGRDREVGLLQDRWEQAVEGMGQVVLIIGEAGLGKSRLVQVIKEHVGKETAGVQRPIVEWRTSPYCQNSSLHPVIDCFERLLRFRSDETPQDKLDKLVGHLQEFDLSGDEVGPLFASLLSIPLDGRFPELSLSPARQREKTLAAVLDWLRACAARQPVLFIVEDLHWIDPSTLELLALHVQQGLRDRILTLFTFRPEFETPWKSLAHQTAMALNRLTKRQITEMMQRQTNARSLPASVVDQVVARTDGVPLFVEEFTRMVIEAGYLHERAGSMELSGSFPVHEIPATLQDLLMARLDRIASDREVVQLVAALGRDFSDELLRSVSTLDEASLRAELAKLVDAEVLIQKGQPPNCSYTFKHALIQDAAYLSMLKSKRQQCHQRIAEGLEARFPETASVQPELLAHHFTEAGLTRPAIDYWLKAGLRSQDKSANREAIDHFTRGLQLVGTLDEGHERDRLELEFQVHLGAALVSTRGYAAPEVGPVYDRAHALSQKIGDARRRFHVLYGLWGWHLVRDELEYSRQLSDETMELARTLADPGILMEAYHLPANTLYYLGEFKGALDACEQGFTLYDRERCMQYARVVGQNSGVTLQSYWSLALWNLGYPDQALARSRSAVALAKELGHPFSMCYALHFAAWLHHYARLGQEAQAYADAEHRLATEQGFAFWKATGLLFGGAGLLLQGKIEEAVQRVGQGLEGFRATGAQLSLSYYNSFLAETQRHSGRLDDAFQTVEDALGIVAKTHNRYYHAELLRLKGELLLERCGDMGGAESCFTQSLAVARSQAAKSWELRTAMSLTRLWRQQGKRQQAQELLAPIYGWFTEGFATPDLIDAKALVATFS
jgi:class 3 adenylate cyclase/predicted ATPase